MAIIKPSALIAEIRGRIGGSIFQSSPYGNVVKQGNLSGSRNSLLKSKRQAEKGGTRGWWGLLTEEQQEAWTLAAQNFPTTNRYGDEYTSTGYNFFLRASWIFPPEIRLANLDPPARVDDGTVWNLGVKVEDQQFLVTCERVSGAADCYLVVFAQVPGPTSQRRPRNHWRLVAGRAVNADLVDDDWTAFYEEAFYEIPPGARVHYYAIAYAQWSPQQLGFTSGYSPTSVTPPPPPPTTSLITESGARMISENDNLLIPEGS